MSEPDKPSSELETLRAERAGLLDELEAAYKHLEEILSTKNYETEIAYQELRKRNQELQQKLAELQEAQLMLVRAERMSAMGQMAAAIVHEINNPLTVLLGRVQLLLMKKRLNYRSEVLVIREAAERLGGMTRNILRFARRQCLDQTAFSLELNPLVEEVLSFFLPLLKRIECRTELAPSLPRVRGNAAQVEQVMTNFIINAADALADQPCGRLVIATGRGSIAELMAAEKGRETRLAVQGQEEGWNRPGVYAAVRDNGPGISPELMGQIFEAFFTTKGVDKGTGLGLAICRSIAENLQGNVLVASKAGEGAAFFLVLPAASAEGERSG
jgi:two-component system NtrC family sensor kinase